MRVFDVRKPVHLTDLVNRLQGVKAIGNEKLALGMSSTHVLQKKILQIKPRFV